MSDPTPEARDAAEARGKTAAILDAAQELFAAFGFRRTAMDDIARAAGVAKGTLYLYFDGKEAVFRAMHARTLAELSCSCDHAEAADLPFAERLYLLLDAQCGKAHERYARSAHLLELDDTRTRIGADLGRAADAAYAERLLRVFQAADTAGEIDLEAAGLSAQAVVETLLAATRGAKQGPEGPLELAAYRGRLRQIADLAAAAVRPRRT
ncbi:MAG: helix-turn-helix domain-containing protein [Phenylobacterium sp.]|jgi:AcrR family transcriptional regulator|nr:helix-turn-helix domain-containing protein [Phenylobacterium sp.]MDZ4318866.1 helix-turn-helix domain-containing protein [Phenylobacterium sp.]